MDELKQRVADILHKLNIPQTKLKIEDLGKEASDPAFWQDQVRATAKMKELAALQKEVEEGEFLEMLVAEGNETELRKLVEKMEIKVFLSGTYDRSDAILAIHAGQGGTEAMDWSSMLFRMYSRFIESKGWTWEEIEYTPGDEAGIKSVTITVNGAFAYGMLKCEAGTHRLVRQSPFNADKLRQTSFALVEVLPDLVEVDLPDIEIKDSDLEWQFFHSSSQGGQNVQKVSTAVRLTHKPTGIVVTSQRERFQEANRKLALGLLRSKLWIKKQEELTSEKRSLKGEWSPASWGTQIRSYVLHPYKMVKDLRTGVESGNPTAVLDGELDDFVNEELTLSI